MAIELTVTIEGRKRPWWRPLGLRAVRRWYRHSRKAKNGRLLSALAALLIARMEFRLGDRSIA